MDRFLVVCAGSAVGGGARYLISIGAAARWGTAFPYGTLIVNVAGCFLITLIMHIAAATMMPTNLRLFLTTGLMGGLTTYSTFDYETTKFFQDGASTTAVANLGATLIVCFAAGLLGIATGRLIAGD